MVIRKMNSIASHFICFVQVVFQKKENLFFKILESPIREFDMAVTIVNSKYMIRLKKNLFQLLCMITVALMAGCLDEREGI